ncbi:MAG TPA: SCO family protein [Streptosporangiaceae bacterium]|nr:SCO family protein [Streptosporangiaceae bacterium]
MKTPRIRGPLTAAAALTVLTGIVGLAGCGTSASSATGMQVGPESSAAEMNPNLDLGSSLGGQSAPDIALLNQFGQPMSLSQFRGKVVVLSFQDSECTTVCPLTAQSMLEAKQMLGPAGSQVQLLGVDANPDATSVADVLAYSRAHGLVNQWDFLTGSPAQLKAAWSAYHIAVEIEQGQIDHTPALFVIDQRGREQKLYLTQMAYSSVGQSAQVLADELASLLPGHPRVASQQSLASIAVQGPSDRVVLSAATGPGQVVLGPGAPRLVMFFATWLTEVTDLRSVLTAGNAYVAMARRDGLPQLTAVDETVVEPSVQAVRAYLHGLGTPLSYPVALDTTGRVADGYGVQDQPWLDLVSASGQAVWSHDGWLPPPALIAAVRHALHP